MCKLQCFPHTSGHYKLRTNNCCISGGTSTLWILEGTFRYLLAKPVEVHQSSGYWQAPSGRGYSTEHVFPIAAASILLRDVLAAGAAPSSTVASVECETSASPFWRSVYCSKMETKLFSQVLSFSISMCVRQMRPIHFSAVFHWHYLTRTMLFSCRYVLTGAWHKHLSISRMAENSLDTPLYTCELKCQATLATPAYLFQYNQDRNDLQWWSRLPIRSVNE